MTRLLGAPGNWTLDTVSDLFLGMGYEPALSATDILALQTLTETTVEERSRTFSNDIGMTSAKTIQTFKVNPISTLSFSEYNSVSSFPKTKWYPQFILNVNDALWPENEFLGRDERKDDELTFETTALDGSIRHG